MDRNSSGGIKKRYLADRPKEKRVTNCSREKVICGFYEESKIALEPIRPPVQWCQSLFSRE